MVQTVQTFDLCGEFVCQNLSRHKAKQYIYLGEMEAEKCKMFI